VRSGKRGPRIPVPKTVEAALDAALDRALAVEGPVVAAYVARVRRRRPGADPAQVIEQLERRYLAIVMGTGAAAGGTAAMPGIGTSASVAAGGLEIAGFVSATAMYALAVADVHGIPMEDPQARRALVLTVLLGDIGAVALAGGEVEAADWARVLGHTGARELKGINARIMQLLVARFGARHGLLIAGRALPFGIGAGFGAAGNLALGRSVVRTARRLFGPPPAMFPHSAGEVIDVDPVDDRWRSAARRTLPIRRK
jgi:hypothetical protein